jgi:transcription initiation factor TFIID subunit TAF12
MNPPPSIHPCGHPPPHLQQQQLQQQQQQLQQQQHQQQHHELSFEDFTTMSPFLDHPASLHLANPYATSLASTASMASSAASAAAGKSNYFFDFQKLWRETL